MKKTLCHYWLLRRIPDLSELVEPCLRQLRNTSTFSSEISSGLRHNKDEEVTGSKDYWLVFRDWILPTNARSTGTRIIPAAGCVTIIHKYILMYQEHALFIGNVMIYYWQVTLFFFKLWLIKSVFFFMLMNTWKNRPIKKYVQKQKLKKYYLDKILLSSNQIYLFIIYVFNKIRTNRNEWKSLIYRCPF